MNTTLKLADWLHLIRLIRSWLNKADELLDLPDPDDPSAVYGWCRMVLVLARESVKLTPTEVDDRAVAWLLDGPFASFDAFMPYYKVFAVILRLVMSDETPEVVASHAVEAGGAETASLLADNKAGLDPISLIALVVQVVRIIIDLRRKHQ